MRIRGSIRVWCVGTAWALALCAAVAPAAAESALELPRAEPFDLGARTFDDDGAEIGSSRLSLARAADGGFALALRVSAAEVARADLSAELAPVGTSLRPTRQRSVTRHADGSLEIDLEIDHLAGRVRCDEGDGASELALPAGERVANAVLPLATSGLAPGEHRDLTLVLCRGEPRLLKAVARAAPAANGEAPGVVAVELDIELPSILHFIARWLPSTVFWHAGSSPSWIGHRGPVGVGTEIMLMLRPPYDPKPFLP